MRLRCFFVFCLALIAHARAGFFLHTVKLRNSTNNATHSGAKVNHSLVNPHLGTTSGAVNAAFNSTQQGPNVSALPHMSSTDLHVFDAELDNASTYLEWGSGGSTAYVVKRDNIKEMYTLESDGAWLKELATHRFIQQALNDNRLILELRDIGRTGKWGHPVNASANTTWPHYSDFPVPLSTNTSLLHARRTKEHFDLIYVDGRFRVACFLKALRDAPRPFRLMIHDYERPEYHVVERFATKIKQGDILAVFTPKESINKTDFDATIRQYEFAEA